MSIPKIAFESFNFEKKSKLAKAVAHHFKSYLVKDYAVEYQKMVQRDLVLSDMKRVAQGQLNLENEFLEMGGKLLFCEATIFTHYVFCQENFGETPAWIAENYKQNDYAKRFIFKEEEELFTELSCIVIEGDSFEKQLEFCVEFINHFFPQSHPLS